MRTYNGKIYLATGYSCECNIDCEHCISRDACSAEVKMDLAAAQRLLRDCREAGISYVSLGFGEPMLYLDELCVIVGMCRQYRMVSRVITNAYWAYNLASARLVVSRLAASGLKVMTISADRFHQKYIPFENILNAAEACVEKGLKYWVLVTGDGLADDISIVKQVQSRNLICRENQLAYFRGMSSQDPPIRYRRATKCRLDTLTVTPDLRAYACCSIGGYFHNTNIFYLGDLNRDDIENVVRSFKETAIYKLIRTTEMSELAASVGLHHLSTREIPLCNLCKMIFNHRERTEVLVSIANAPDLRRSLYSQADHTCAIEGAKGTK